MKSSRLFQERKMISKKGSIMDMFVIIIVAVILVIFFGAILFVFNQVDTVLSNVPDIPNSNLSIANFSADTIGQVTDGLDYLKFIAFIIVFGMMISLLITNALLKSHPLFYGVYVFVTIIGVVFSVYVSNAYEDLLVGNTLSSTLTEFTAMNFFILNLPVAVAVLGIFGAILLFINIPRDQDLVGGIR